MDLDKLRTQIDSVDQEIIERLNQRVKLAGEIGRIKIEQGKEIYVPSREEQVFRRLEAINDGPLDSTAIRTIYREIISAAISLEKGLKIAYLGPEATYTHQAAMKNFGSSVNYVPLMSIADVFETVKRGEADYGVIPIENSIEGAVFHSLDMLAETDLKIVAQIYLHINHCLLSHSQINEIKQVLSKDNALGQCRHWFALTLPGVELVKASSTAAAVREIQNKPGSAAVASKVAAELYNVPIVAENIQDLKDNVTRFLVIGKEVAGRLGEKQDKSSFLFSVNDEPGTLLKAITPFSKNGVNLTKIESRPSRKKAWDYLFFVDVIGHYEDKAVHDAVKELEKTCRMVKWLGSYPNTSL